VAGSSTATGSTPSTLPLCMRGGLQPDLSSDAGWWQTPLWRYAVFAVVVYSRAAAERLAVPVDEVAQRIAARHNLELTA
jgi:hypothetical protein